MKKKENLWDLLKRLDEEAGQLNIHLSEANRYFDNTSMATKKLIDKHEEDMHKLIGKIRKGLKPLLRQTKKKTKKKNE